jgi:signal transduction histidine kinase
LIAAIKRRLKPYWPSLRLRTILFGTLLFTAALPGVGALFLRVYENTLVRQTEAELIAQGAALVAVAAATWPGADPLVAAPMGGGRFLPEASTIDLRTSPVLAERPSARPVRGASPPAAADLQSRLTPIIDQTQRTTLASIQLVDATGRILIGYQAGGSYAHVPEIRAALSGRVQTVLRKNGAYSQRYAFEWLSRASALRIHHVRPVRVGDRVVGALVLSRSPRALFRGLYEDRGKILLGIGLIFATLIALTVLLSRGIARPIDQLAETTRQVALGKGVVPEPPVTAVIEIRGLFDNFRAMAEAIDRRSRYLRDFAAAVSHEFKTPLAGIAGAVELFEDHGDSMTGEERRRFLGNIKADAARLSQLVSRLLDLARADMSQPGSQPTLDPTSLVRRIADAYPDDGFSVEAISAARAVAVQVPTETIEAVLTTLIDNARQAGARRVKIDQRDDGDMLCLLVQDDGPGINPADSERIFEPFYTTRRSSGGTGMGLTIAASLLRAAGGSIRLTEHPGNGTRFEMALPKA